MAATSESEPRSAPDSEPGVVTTRRDVLRWMGSGTALVLSGAWWPEPADAQATRAAPGANARSPVTAWVRIPEAGPITLIASQSEMGQGTTTTLAAALAYELYMSLADVRIEFAPFDPAYRDPVYQWMFTGNSQGTSSFYDMMRRMGAAAREMLLTAAARRLDVPVGTLRLKDGRIRAPSGRALTVGKVAADAAQLPVPKQAALRSDSEFAGQTIPRWDIPSKVDGSAVFGIDVNRPGMLVATVACAPKFGARLLRYDAAAIEASPGVVAVVEVPNGIAVVARTYWQAHTAMPSARLVWSEEGSALSSGTALPEVYGEKLRSGPFFTHKSLGDAASAAAGAPHVLEALYELPFEAHATMEPMNCTADVTAGRCDLWVPTQGVEMCQRVAAQVTGLPSDRITVHRTFLGGGFGRRLLADYVKQALLVSMAVKRPVKLIWSREEDMTHDFYRPAMLHHVTGALDGQRHVAALAHRVVSPSYLLYVWPRATFTQDWTEPAAPPEKYDTMAVEGLMDIPYSIPNQTVAQHRLALDVPVSVWRTTGHGANNFVLESFVDELAAAAKTDPLVFRRRMLSGNPRALKLLDVLAERSAWNHRPGRGTAQGMALASAFGGLIATSVELSVSDSTIKLHRAVSVVDCGTVLDPRIAESNILGGLVWGLSGLRTAVTFREGRVEQSNFDRFDPFHLWETPPAEVYFVNSGAKLGGTGELGPVPVVAAVCNAVYAATGKRIRSLPLTREGLRFI